MNGDAKKIVLAEEYPDMEGLSGWEVIALEAPVSYQMDKRGRSYGRLDDLCRVEKRLLAGQKEYFYEQLREFKGFDRFIGSNISFCSEHNIPLAMASYLRLKNFTDTFLMDSCILRDLFSGRDKITEVLYFHDRFDPAAGNSIFRLRSIEKKYFDDLLKVVCGGYGIKYTARSFGKERKAVEGKNKDKGLATLKHLGKNIINIMRYEKISAPVRNKSLKGLGVLLMHAGTPDIDHPLKEFIRNGCRVYLIENGSVFREDPLIRRRVDIPGPEKSFYEKLKKDAEACAGRINGETGLVRWINDKCGFDVSNVVIPFLRDFILKEGLDALVSARRFHELYRNEGIKYVFARANTSLDSLGPLIAARYMGTARSVCVQHACVAQDAEVFGVFDTETYNCTFVRDGISEKDYKESVENRYPVDCKIKQSPHYLKHISDRYSGGRRQSGRNVLYVEKKFYSRVKSLNDVYYTQTWYYKLQKYLLEYFGSRDDISFFYSHPAGQKWAEKSILRYIEDKNWRNIQVVHGRFVDNMRFAEKIIVDYPSGALFEAAQCGKQVLCICPERFKYQDRAREIFGKSLRNFGTLDECRDIIKDFISSGPDEYKVDLGLTDRDFIDQFKDVLTADHTGVLCHADEYVN